MIRFPLGSYHNINFENIVLTDTALSSKEIPIDGSSDVTETNIIFKSTAVNINHWGSEEPLNYINAVRGQRDHFAGTGNSIDIAVSIKN